MFTWIGNKAYSGSDAPENVQGVMADLGDLARLSGLRSPDGGIKRDGVLKAVADRRRRAGLTDVVDAKSPLDALDRDRRIGLRVEAGRAHTNNDALLAVLGAAVNADVDVLVLVVPAVYKGSVTVDRVAERVHWLLHSPGIDLALTGVALTAY